MPRRDLDNGPAIGGTVTKERLTYPMTSRKKTKRRNSRGSVMTWAMRVIPKVPQKVEMTMATRTKLMKPRKKHPLMVEPRNRCGQTVT